MKDALHRRTLRRKIGKSNTVHVKRRFDGSIERMHTQRPLKVSRVMQAFRSAAVTERIIRDVESEKHLGRKQLRMASTGFSTAAQGAAAYHKVKAQPMEEDSIYTHLSRIAMEDKEYA